MKRIIIASFVALLMIGAASPASALTIADIQSQIQTLLARVAELQEQLRQRSAGETSDHVVSTETSSIQASPRVCQFVYPGALTVGARGDHVKSVQEFLKQEGLLEAEATGYFGPLTEAAVRRFQADKGVVSSGSAATTGWGTLGPRTWESIRVRCANQNNARFSVTPQRGPAPLTVTFSTNTTLSNPGMIADAGDYKIVFGDGTEHVFSCTGSQPSCPGPHTVAHTYTSDGTYVARLVHFGFFGPASESVNGVTVAEQKIYVGSDIACTKEYVPVCGSKQVVCITTPCNPVQQTYGNKCMMEADGATFVHAGQCGTSVDPSQDKRCKSWYDGCNTCGRETADGPAFCTLRACIVQGPAYCTGYFDDTGNKAPVISGFSGPTTLTVNQTGTWTVSASDPEGGTLSYRISWGDAHAAPSAALSELATDFAQTTTFTHAYSAAGTYVVTIVVRDSAGKEAKTTATVKVGSDAIVCTEQYAPVCGQPPEPACRYTQPYCLLPTPGPQTYANKCYMQAAGATLLYEGTCQNGPVACTADAKQCPDGTYVGRTGPHCQFVCPSTTEDN